MLVSATFSVFFVWNAIQFNFVCCDTKHPVYNSLRSRLALDVFKARNGKNALVSTLLVKFPLCKLATVAVGDAKKELLSVLGYRNDRSIKSCYTEVKEVLDILKESDLTVVNKMYINYTDDIQPDFKTNSSLMYGVQVEKIGFNYPSSAMSFINRWITTTTYRRIRDVVEKNDIDKNTTMLLVSAAHFKATWEFPFNPKLTSDKKFHLRNNKMITMSMISKIDDFLYWEDEANELRILTINLGSWATSVTFIVPNGYEGLPEFLEKLYKKPDLLTMTKKMMRFTRMRVFLPRFKIKSHVDWTDYLQQIGLKRIFNNETSGLEGILRRTAATKHISLNKVKQKVFLEMDEMGVAKHNLRPDIDLLERVMIGPGVGLTEFTADRPFYFTISIALGSVTHDIFNGVFYGPESN